ncbi:hypothetical protein JOY44_19725 [Phormidium sp. CLA17]|uniref:hypothetical protein n=1 Tax=Leptolyngbya sp. Cla-17 TaxID=2803751 RepID=UPI001491259A|nr:hypothetical protein [Leptolyngbya sp. Cla-17]MBM0743820.1 hypothetical protein [Leptolyngbya sp. Cla-17]
MNKNNPFSLQDDHELYRKRPTPLLPRELLEVSTIDILILDGSGAIGGLNILDNAPRKRIEDQAVQKIADLFRQLPSGDPARCHTPPFGLRFYTQDSSQRQCSICWQCNNIYGDFQYDFDAEDSISQNLLALLTQLSK